MKRRRTYKVLFVAMILLATTHVWSKPRCPRGGAEARPLPAWPHKKDPPPLVTSGYLVCTISMSRGKIKILALKRGAFAKPQVLAPRFRGRYAVNLYSYKKHLDVIRFDFPLAGGTSKFADPLTRQLGEGVEARVKIKLPFDERVTRAVIIDTASQKETPLDLKKLRKKQPSLPAPELRTSTFKPRP